jgi:glycosyltransferase involved in cell wall biosynthesis
LPARSRALTVHDVIPLLRPEWMYEGAEAEVRGIIASIDPGTDFVIVNSRMTGRDLRGQIELPEDRIFVTPFAASSTVFFPEPSPARQREARRRYGIPDGPYLLSLGALEPRKNLLHLLHAWSELLEGPAPPDGTLILVGPVGWKADPVFRAMAERPALAGRVHHTGFVADEDLAALYSGARAFVYPSLYEGFGLPVLEAMQCGVPVIASNTTSLPEVGGDAVEYVDPLDRPALVAALHRLWTDTDRREELRRRGLAHSTQFSWDRTAGATASAYREMISRTA